MSRLDSAWGWVNLYQDWVRNSIHPENRRTALFYMATAVICFDRAERAQ